VRSPRQDGWADLTEISWQCSGGVAIGFARKKIEKNHFLKFTIFSGILFFIGTFFFFFFAGGIFGTLLKCLGEIEGNRERDSSVSLPPCLPACLPSCLPSCLPACLSACPPA
jgi:hypothetical protein